MAFASGLYSGIVGHKRLRPRRHALNYRVFWLLLDLDELDALGGSLRLFSRNRFNLLSFHDADHGATATMSLRQQAEEQLLQAGITTTIGAIRLLTMPRVLGYAFNPISLFFCHGTDGELVAVIYEVNNTFGQRHFYLAAIAGADAADGLFRHACRKAFYVSPFMGMNLDYDFALRPPAETMSLAVSGSDDEGLVITTAMSGRRQPMTDASLFRAALTHPLLTFKVIVGIHWEALKLWRKGVPLTERPAPPRAMVTLISGKSA